MPPSISPAAASTATAARVAPAAFAAAWVAGSSMRQRTRPPKRSRSRLRTPMCAMRVSVTTGRPARMAATPAATAPGWMRTVRR